MSERRLTIGMKCPQMRFKDYDEDQYGGYRFQDDLFNELSAMFVNCEKEAVFEIEANNTVIYAHVDILCKTPGGWAVFEAKSGRFDPFHIWQAAAYRYIVEKALNAHVDAALVYPTFIITDSIYLARELAQILPTYYIPNMFNNGEKYVAVSVLRWKYKNASMGPWCAYCENESCRLKHIFNTTRLDLKARKLNMHGMDSEDKEAKTL